MCAVSGRAAIVSGAASGIGRGVAQRLADCGYGLVLIDRSGDSLARVMRELGPTVSSHAVEADLSSIQGSRGAIEHALTVAPGSSVLVHSAGVLRPGKMLDLPVEHWDEMFGVHARAPWLLARGFIEGTREAAAANERRHRIVAVSSTAANRPRTGNGGYSASKAALNMAMQVLAAEAAPLGYNVNVVTPGRTNTPLMTAGAEDPDAKAAGWKPSSLPPMGKIAEPDDIAAVVGFLCGPDSTFMTGANLVVDGGATAAVRG